MARPKLYDHPVERFAAYRKRKKESIPPISKVEYAELCERLERLADLAGTLSMWKREAGQLPSMPALVKVLDDLEKVLQDKFQEVNDILEAESS